MASWTPQKISRSYDGLRNNSRPKPNNQVSQDAYKEIVSALSKDMPLIMHGSGDVRETNAASELLLSRLTADYISNLVGAAVDAHAILNGGQRPPLPPPPPCKKRKEPPLPAPYIWPADIAVTVGASNASKSKSAAASKKKSAKGGVVTTSDNKSSASASKSDPNLHGRRQRDVDYWDEPLPEPKIKGRPAPEPPREDGLPHEKVFDGVKIGDWVGVAGVDFFSESRARSAHITMPAAIGTQSFLFPVCHDPGLYGKVLDIQSARRGLEPLLANTTIRDIIRNESGALRSQRRRENKTRRNNNNKKKSKASSAAASAASGDEDDDLLEEEDEPEATDSEDDELGGAVWPGLEELLPVHTTNDFVRSTM